MTDDVKTPARKTAAKKVEAAKAEATETPVTFEHAGITFTLPHPLDMPLDLLETEDEIYAARLMVGDEKWAEYKATRPTIRDFGDFTEKLTTAQGRDTDSGN